MVREFFAVELDKETQVPITGFERLPAETPGQRGRVYKISTGPSREPRIWPVKFSILFGVWESPAPLPLGILLYTIQDILIDLVGGLIIILIAVIVTSFFIPNMLRPGSVVMLLSKPISRTTLLLFKYLGGLFFVIILTTFVVGGVWLITGIRAGVWAPGVFIVVPLMTMSFAILYAISTVTAVWSRNSIVAILVTLACAGFLWLVGKAEVASRVHRVMEDQEGGAEEGGAEVRRVGQGGGRAEDRPAAVARHRRADRTGGGRVVDDTQPAGERGDHVGEEAPAELGRDVRGDGPVDRRPARPGLLSVLDEGLLTAAASPGEPGA